MNDIQQVFSYAGAEAFVVEDRGRTVAIVPANVKTGRDPRKIAGDIARLSELKDFVKITAFVQLKRAELALREGRHAEAHTIVAALIAATTQLKKHL